MSISSFFRAGRKSVAALVAGGLAVGQATAALTPEQDRLVAANNAFAFNLMTQVAQGRPQANVFLSPFSVSSVLQMVDNGAAGETKREMQRALQTEGLGDTGLNGAFRALDQQLTGRPDVILNLANGMWVKDGFHLQPAFVKANQDFFQAELAAVDFDQPQSAQAINDWADRKTAGRIREVVHFPFPPLTRLILANAIYFKGTWVTPFKPDQTRPREFHPAGGAAKMTPMMTQSGHFSYQETADFQAVRLPYKGGLQMELFLPATNASAQQLIAGLAGSGRWGREIQSGFSGREGVVTLPKFRLEYEVKLNEALQALGMKSAFGAGADFSGITGDKALHIDEVRQKSFVEVNEQGTEAAAVTTVTFMAKGVMRPTERFVMVLDRPFWLVISDAETGSILFMGIVNDPAAGN